LWRPHPHRANDRTVIVRHLWRLIRTDHSRFGTLAVSVCIEPGELVAATVQTVGEGGRRIVRF
jgi:hypothetical protein